MKRYKVLLLDADGTILDFHRAEENALHAACQAMGLSVTPAQAAEYRRINDALWQAFEQGKVTQAELKVLRFERFLSYLGANRDARDMAAAFLNALGLQSDEIPGAEAFLREAARRVPVIIVTNGIPQVQRSRFGLSRLGAYITDYAISGELGFAKPDPRLITHALALAGACAGDALMVGDEPRSDIAAANAAEVDSAWYNPAGRKNETGHAPTYEVRALPEVLAWL